MATECEYEDCLQSGEIVHQWNAVMFFGSSTDLLDEGRVELTLAKRATNMKYIQQAVSECLSFTLLRLSARLFLCVWEG